MPTNQPPAPGNDIIIGISLDLHQGQPHITVCKNGRVIERQPLGADGLDVMRAMELSTAASSAVIDHMARTLKDASASYTLAGDSRGHALLDMANVLSNQAKAVRRRPEPQPPL